MGSGRWSAVLIVAALGLLLAPPSAPAKPSPRVTLTRVTFELDRTEDQGPAILVRYVLRNRGERTSRRLPVRIYLIAERALVPDVDLSQSLSPRVQGHGARLGSAYRLVNAALPPMHLFACLGMKTPREGGRCREASSLLNLNHGDFIPPLGKPLPGPRTLTVSPFQHDFGPVQIGTTSPAHTFTVKNISTADRGPLEIDFAFWNGTYFSLSNDACTGVILMPDGECTFDVSFTPPFAQSLYDFVSATYPGYTGHSNATVTGSGTN